MPVVALLALDGAPAHQLSTPAMLFGAASRTFYRRPPYEVRVCAGGGTVGAADAVAGTAHPAVRTAAPGAMTVTADHGLDGLLDAATVIVTGYASCPAPPPPDVLDALRAAAARGSRVAAIGTGTFALAAAGLLDGRRATTSWPDAAELARRHPRVEVELGDWPVADGPFLTSSGLLGGKDLCVRIIEEDHDEQTAREADRHLFLALPNPSEALRADTAPRPTPDTGPAPDTAPHPDFTTDPTATWLEANLHRPLTLSDIAAHAGTSVRTLTRHFRAHTGLTPLQYLLRARVRRAQWLLEHTDTPVEQIPTTTGLGTPANLRHHFHRFNGTTPTIYRAAFRNLVGIFAPEDATRGDVDS
ncbi:GlxA family transcriptional regulator [Streptomyces aureoverticillatus]|uniref:GlxA family transcriptional regulator n=1 Tax=Streptomyces aureoverticillatus TaxID=66871 RepID=UPI0013DD223C|nr:helix-turn-helix domain-containing protein [Streptomyces aureoverticillatus]QIB46026.1 helix-turn-helix domain-containing protein [Streptomyces aureoverticillatus]